MDLQLEQHMPCWGSKWTRKGDCDVYRAYPIKIVDGEGSQNGVVGIFFKLGKGDWAAHLLPMTQTLLP